MRLFRFYQNLVHGTCPIFWEKNFVLKFWGQKVAKNEVYLVLSKVDAWNFSDLLHHVAAAWRLKIYIETKIKTLIKTKILHWCFRIESAQNEVFEYYDKSIHWILSIFSKNLWQKIFWQIVLGFIGQIKKKIGPKSGFLSLCGMEAWNVSGFLIEVTSAWNCFILLCVYLFIFDKKFVLRFWLKPSKLGVIRNCFFMF